MAKGLFGKFFEEVETPKNNIDRLVEDNYSVHTYDGYKEEIEAMVPENITSNMIDGIYEENHLSDKSRSIYMIEIYQNTLPGETPIEVKSVTVKNILAASNILIDEVINDATKRVEVLESVNEKIEELNNIKINEANEQIERLKAQIEELNSIIYTAKNEIAQSASIVNDEITKINNLEKFINISGGK